MHDENQMWKRRWKHLSAFPQLIDWLCTFINDLFGREKNASLSSKHRSNWQPTEIHFQHDDNDRPPESQPPLRIDADKVKLKNKTIGPMFGYYFRWNCTGRNQSGRKAIEYTSKKKPKI